MDKLDPQLGQDVVVTGAGVIGLLNAMVARLRGARVVVSEPDAARRARALELGVHAVIDPSAGPAGEQLAAVTGGGADIVIVAIGSHRANLDAIDMVAEYGKVMLFASAHPATDLAIDPNWIHRKQVTVTGARHPSPEGFAKAVKLLAKGLIDVEPLIEHRVPLDEIERAFELAIKPDTYRVIVQI
jgi:L-iditol 2-dehydrogenase